ncbi:MAG: YfgM family protein [Succinivibrionaceae bacterium]
MDIFEQDAQQREEELQHWWQENWKSIILGIIFALVVISAVWMYRDHLHAQNKANASSFYTTIMRADQKDEKFIEIAKNYLTSHQNIFGQLTALTLAKSYIEKAKYQEAYDVLVNNLSLSDDKLVFDIMADRAVRLGIELKKYDEVKKLLGNFKTDAYKVASLELKGDLAKAQGNNKEALEAYEQAITAIEKMKQENSSFVRDLTIINMKKNSLKTVSGANLEVAKEESVKEKAETNK